MLNSELWPDLRAVLGSGQDGVLSDAVMSPCHVQGVAKTVI